MDVTFGTIMRMTGFNPTRLDGVVGGGAPRPARPRALRGLDAPELLADVYNGRTFTDGRAVVKSIGKQEKKAVA